MPAYKDSKTGKWYCQFYYKDWTGKNKHKVKRGFERKKDAEEWERKFKNTAQVEDITMSALIVSFLQSVDTSVKLGNLKVQSAYRKQRIIERYIKPYFSDVLASKIKVKDINEWLAKINHHSSHNRILSSSYLGTIKDVLKQIFEYGEKNFNLESNPVLKTDKIKSFSPDTRAKFWTLEQYSLFYSNLKSEQDRLIFNLMFFAGLRIGEVLALTDDAVTPFKIEVKETYAKIPGKVLYNTPKTKTSLRVVAIPHQLYAQFKTYTERIYGLKPKDRIFSVSPCSVRYRLNSLTQKLALPKISPHILRHSYASMLYSQTKNILVVANQIGHKNPSITYDVYSHLLPTEGQSAADILDNFMLKIPQK